VIEPLTGIRTLTAWTVNPPMLLVVASLGAAYWLAVKGLHRRGQIWPKVRSVSFAAGLVTVVLVTMSFVGVYADALFWVRAVQTIVLLMVSPLLLALGAPLTLILASVPAKFATRLRQWGRGNAARTLTLPFVVSIFLIAPPFLLYFTPLYRLCLRFSTVDTAVHFSLLLCGFLYFWTRLRVDPTPREGNYLVSLWISLTEVIFDGVLGLAIWFGPLITGDYYQALARAWGPDLRLDQIIGAGVLWIGGDIAGLPFVCALFVRWARDDQRQAKEIDRELDAREDELAKESSLEPGKSPLWWDNDPVFAERFKNYKTSGRGRIT
jgi:cytochrome c oxidase assembly factor CtaG